MRAALITCLDGPNAVEIADVPMPEEQDAHVLVDVHAAGIAFPDVLQSKGLYQQKPELPFVPGTEVAGVVRWAPPGNDFKVGDRVAAFPGLGGFAEVVSVPKDQVFPLPDSITFTEAAGIPMNLFTVHFALAHRCAPAPGETLLVHGAAGGVGIAAVQFAHALGNPVIAVASTEEKRELAKRAGATHAIGVENFLEETKELTGGRGVDIVVDPVGGDRFTDSLRSLASGGRLLVIGFTGGEIPTVRVNRLLLSNTSVIGVGWGAYWSRHPGYLRTQWDDFAPLLDKLTPVIGATYPLERISEALAQMDSRGALGKIIIEVSH